MSTAEMPRDDLDEGVRRGIGRPAAVVAVLLLFAAGAAMLPSVIRPRKAPDSSREAMKKLQDLRDEDRKILSSYAVSKKPYRIPIDRAMALIAEESARSSAKGDPRP